MIAVSAPVSLQHKQPDPEQTEGQAFLPPQGARAAQRPTCHSLGWMRLSWSADQKTVEGQCPLLKVDFIDCHQADLFEFQQSVQTWSPQVDPTATGRDAPAQGRAVQRAGRFSSTLNFVAFAPEVFVQLSTGQGSKVAVCIGA